LNKEPSSETAPSVSDFLFEENQRERARRGTEERSKGGWGEKKWGSLTKLLMGNQSQNAGRKRAYSKGRKKPRLIREGGVTRFHETVAERSEMCNRKIRRKKEGEGQRRELTRLRRTTGEKKKKGHSTPNVGGSGKGIITSVIWGAQDLLSEKSSVGRPGGGKTLRGPSKKDLGKNPSVHHGHQKRGKFRPKSRKGSENWEPKYFDYEKGQAVLKGGKSSHQA